MCLSLFFFVSTSYTYFFIFFQDGPFVFSLICYLVSFYSFAVNSLFFFLKKIPHHPLHLFAMLQHNKIKKPTFSPIILNDRTCMDCGFYRLKSVDSWLFFNFLRRIIRFQGHENKNPRGLWTDTPQIKSSQMTANAHFAPKNYTPFNATHTHSQFSH